MLPCCRMVRAGPGLQHIKITTNPSPTLATSPRLSHKAPSHPSVSHLGTQSTKPPRLHQETHFGYSHWHSSGSSIIPSHGGLGKCLIYEAGSELLQKQSLFLKRKHSLVNKGKIKHVCIQREEAWEMPFPMQDEALEGQWR